MNILFLGNNNPLIEYLYSIDEKVTTTSKKILLDDIKDYDFIISYGYRHIIKKDIIDFFKNRIINLHISYLPYNRGADPNLWSLLDGTQSGVTIHYMDYHLDTGDILVQNKVTFNSNATLASSYEKLHNEIQLLFKTQWNNIKSGNIFPISQENMNFTYHSLKDKTSFFDKITPNGWDTKINDIKKLYDLLK